MRGLAKLPNCAMILGGSVLGATAGALESKLGPRWHNKARHVRGADPFLVSGGGRDSDKYEVIKATSWVEGLASEDAVGFSTKVASHLHQSVTR